MTGSEPNSWWISVMLYTLQSTIAKLTEDPESRLVYLGIFQVWKNWGRDYHSLQHYLFQLYVNTEGIHACKNDTKILSKGLVCQKLLLLNKKYKFFTWTARANTKLVSAMWAVLVWWLVTLSNRTLLFPCRSASHFISSIPQLRGSLGHHRWFRSQFPPFFPLFSTPLVSFGSRLLCCLEVLPSAKRVAVKGVPPIGSSSMATV